MSIPFSMLKDLEKLNDEQFSRFLDFMIESRMREAETFGKWMPWIFAISAICFIVLVLAIILSGGE